MKIQTVLLKGATVGKVEGEYEVGDTVTVKLHDENGMLIKVTGEIEEILESEEQ